MYTEEKNERTTYRPVFDWLDALRHTQLDWTGLKGSREHDWGDFNNIDGERESERAALLRGRSPFLSFGRRNPVRSGTTGVVVVLAASTLLLLHLGGAHGFFSFSAPSCNALGGFIAAAGFGNWFGSIGVAFLASGKLYDNGRHVVLGPVP